MTQLEIVGSKLKAKREPAVKGNGKPAKYPYSSTQFEALLKLAKGAGVEVGSSKAQKTKAVNSVTRAVLDEFIANQNKPKTE